MSDSTPPVTPPTPASGANKRWEPPSPEALQALMPGYTIEKLLGKGGMGAVYQGRQTSLDRPVAIKIISNDLDEADASYGERFKNEARAMAKLSHPGIVAVHDFGETASGLRYIVMEFIEGTDVAKMISKEGRLHTEYAMAITAHVCDALAYAHERGIIHRDIKPANIMVGYDGVVKVADFGLAKISGGGETAGLTMSGMAMGTLQYMAPEALMLGTAVDHRADIYAVGVMLYQMLTGKVPHGMFELPSLQVPGLDPRYDAIITKAMREDRAIRYQNAKDLRHDLDSILTQPVIKVDPEMEQAPAALPTEVRPQRPVGQPYRPPPSQTPIYQEKKSSPLPWVAVIAVVAFAAWFLMGHSKPVPVTADNAPPASGSAVSSSDRTPSSSTMPSAATKDQPFVNTLGMKFVPVPILGGSTGGQAVLFSVWDTRVQDYEVFAKETKRAWPKPEFEQSSTHPAVMVSWEDAGLFCQWLTLRERAAGQLEANWNYRLPSDHEWSCAAELGAREDAAKLPVEKLLNIRDVYPWGTQWPPPNGEGNYAGEESRSSSDVGSKTDQNSWIGGYEDSFLNTSPVGGFAANRFGLYDIGGNVLQWCQDWYDKDQKDRVLRGASWNTGSRDNLLSSWRSRSSGVSGNRNRTFGFRCVLSPATYASSTVPAKPAATPQTTSATVALVHASATPPANAVLKVPELAALDQQFIKLQTERVTGVFDADVAKLNTGYLGGLDRELAKERSAGRLDGVLALEEEKKLITAKQPVPPTDDASINAAVKNLRSIYRDAYAKLEAARMVNYKALTDPLVLRLKTLEADLTKQNRIADAKAVREYRETLPEQESKVAYSATNPFTNSLGMKFVPVPGTDVLFCTTLTRTRDYNRFATEAGEKPVEKLGAGEIRDENLFPASTLSWNKAKAFCDWLSKKEGVTYRLPSDREWSIAVGIGSQESKDATPEELNGKLANIYPWGKQWPPPDGVGNFCDESFKAFCKKNKYQLTVSIIKGYLDGEYAIAPVEAMKSNRLGLHDMGGNLRQWCEDWYDATKTTKLLRGSSWGDADPEKLLSSKRWPTDPAYEENNRNSNGFRCVVVASSIGSGNSATAKASTTAPHQMPAASVPPTAAAAPNGGITNSLGMKFVPVPGTDILFCTHITRRQDYAAYAAEVPGVDISWKSHPKDPKGAPVAQGDDYPVVGVNWADAKAFCDWLGKKEGRAYRLPTDREWSFAVGIGEKEYDQKNATPQSLRRKLKGVYPWGSQWPPPNGAGNYSDTSNVAMMQAANLKQTGIPGYTDGYPITSPVFAFKPNKFGLYDMGGNVLQWCEDWSDGARKDRVLRGGHWWFGEDRETLLSSNRFNWNPADRLVDDIGWSSFRCVLVESSIGGGNSSAAKASTATPTTTSPAAASAPKDAFTNTLGMKFVPVPGTDVLFCIHPARMKDYSAYAAETPALNDSWKTQRNDQLPINNGDEYPVTAVTCDEAQAFCAWLSNKEGKAYRLPTDREWSFAAGIGSAENARPDSTPESLSGKVRDVFPWGNQWPPPYGAGNFADTSCREKFPAQQIIEGYTDGYPTTSPVMSFKPNAFGLFDMGGNVKQYCGDWYDAGKKEIVIRGCGWDSFGRANMFLSSRSRIAPDHRGRDGFRCVVANSVNGAASTSTPKLSQPPARITPVNTSSISSSAFTNTLGMKFVPVPGTKVQMCIHETRKVDFANFAFAVPSLNASWKNVRIQDGLTVSATDDHPVVNVSWEEATAFCAWLSKKESKTYRLPSDREWSIAVGLGTKESSLGTPESRNEKLKDLYPWGTAWPPPASVGNYADVTLVARSPSQKAIPGFTDGHATTAPVMSFPPNALGIHDLGGNVWEFCSDAYSTSSKIHVLRGGSWGDADQHWLLSSSRDPFEQTGRYNIVGFRVVVESTAP